MNRPYNELEDIIGYNFKDKELLITALTHSSYINESRGTAKEDNERLEFLGDAVIEFLVSEYLFEKYLDFPEGDLTKTRAAMVCEDGLAKCAAAIGLGKYIRMGKGEEHCGGRDRASITSDAFEALTAAIYLDSGRPAAEQFIKRHLLDTLKDKQLFFDAKTRLQEIIQKNPENVLRYELIDEVGPVHNKQFTAAALLNDKEIGIGSGHSKKEAQQMAAMDAISKLCKNKICI